EQMDSQLKLVVITSLEVPMFNLRYHIMICHTTKNMLVKIPTYRLLLDCYFVLGR
ncbi:hypothetical protein ACJX0J_012336, partial [Zea mays]